MKKFIVYTKDPCPFCVRAIRLLTELQYPFEEIDLTDRLEELPVLKQKWGWQTVPIIIFDGELIGGYMDLKSKLDGGWTPALK